VKDYSFEMCEAETLNRKTFAFYIYRNGEGTGSREDESWRGRVCWTDMGLDVILKFVSFLNYVLYHA
jgi:hypothetical protein